VLHKQINIIIAVNKDVIDAASGNPVYPFILTKTTLRTIFKIIAKQLVLIGVLESCNA
jgi:hypothetical protein